MGREVGGRFKRERTHVYLWLIRVDVWQNPTQYCKAIILQLKIKKRIKVKKKKEKKSYFKILSILLCYTVDPVDYLFYIQ